MQHSSSPRNRHGFTLLELLCVLAVISCLVSLSVFAFGRINTAQSFGKNLHEITSLIELAKTEAIARQTYVWIGFANEGSASNPSAVAGVVYAKDGRGSNLSASNLQPLVKTVRLPNIQFVSRGELKTGTQDLLPPATASVTQNETGAEFEIGPYKFQGVSLTITPSGEILLKGSVAASDGYDPAIDLGFRQAGMPLENAQDAAVVIEGSTGSVKIARVQ